MSTQALNTEAVIRIKHGLASVEITKENGARASKNISLDDLSTVIQANTSLRTPLLPGAWGTKMYVKRGDYEYFLFTTPPMIRDVKFDDGDGDIEEYTIPTPGLAFYVQVRSQNGNNPEILSTSIFALRHQILTTGDTLYRAPYTNVHSNNAICWNGQLVAALPTVSAVASIESQFFMNAFNRDLDGGRFQSFGEANTVRRFFRHLDGKNEFPLERLIATDHTIGSYMSRFIQGQG